MEKRQYKQLNVKKLLKTSFIMNVIQLILILSVIGYALMYDNNDLYGLIYVTLGMITLNSCMTAGGTIEAASRKDKTYFSIELPKVTL